MTVEKNEAPVESTLDSSPASGTSWVEAASRAVFDYMRADSTVKPVGSTPDGTSGDSPGSGVGGGTSGVLDLSAPIETTGSGSGIALGDGRDRGKRTREEQVDIEHVGDKTSKSGDSGKTPHGDDGGDLEHVGGKTVVEGENDCVPREGDDGGLQRVGKGKGSESGASQKVVPDDVNPLERPEPVKGPTDQLPKPTPPVIHDKTGPDRFKGKPTDQIKQAPIRLPGPSAEPNSKYGPHPDSAPDEAPSAEDQEQASEILHAEEVSSAMGLDALAQDAADAIISGHLVDEPGVEPDPENPSLQSIIKDLESKGPEGAQQLDALAKQLGNLLGTTVTPDTDGEFGLDIMTQYNDNRGGCFPSGTSETSLHVGSGGEVTASGQRYWNSNFPRSIGADAGAESLRLQALATRSVMGLPKFLNDLNDSGITSDR